MAIDTISFEEPACGGGLFPDYKHDGVTSGIIISNISSAQKTNKTIYYTAKARSRTMAEEQASPGVLAFRNATTFCLLEGVSNPIGTEIDKQIQSINLDSSTICWKKSTHQRFQRKAPSSVTSKPGYKLLDIQPSLTRLQTQLNEQSNAGYHLIEASLETSTTSSTASNILASDERKKRNLFVKTIPSSSAVTHQYHVVDGGGNTVSERYALWKTQLRDQASQGYQYHSQQVVDVVNTPTNLYNNIFVKKFGDTAVYTIQEQEVNSDTISSTTWTTIPNQLGANGCRLLFAENVLNSKYNYTCSKSNTFKGAYSYRWIAFPSNIDPSAILAILDAQKAEGYTYRTEALLGDDRTRGMIFEKDSTNATIGQNLQYKVFGDGATDRKFAALIDEQISNQGLLGWHLWDGRLTISEGSIISSSKIFTIYANRPQP